MRSGRSSSYQLLVMPLLAAALLLSGAGQVLCLGADGRAGIVNPLIGCASDRSDKDSRDLQPRLAGGVDCVAFFTAGLQAIGAGRPGDKICSSHPQPLFWLTPRLAEVDRSVRLLRWLSQTEPPKEALSLRSVILLI